MLEPVLSTLLSLIEIQLNRPLSPAERTHAENDLKDTAKVIEEKMNFAARSYCERSRK